MSKNRIFKNDEELNKGLVMGTVPWVSLLFISL